MTSLLERPATTSAPAAPRPLALVATLGGALAALAPLLLCLATGVVGWFAADAGSHGTPRDGMRVGALAWLAAHASGISIEGVRITIIPLGLTLLCAWSLLRIGHRVGDMVSGHGPDADRISDGERDLTVPAAVTLFTAAYVVVAIVTTTLAAGTDAAPDSSRVVLASTLLSLAVAAPAIAVGSGRAAIWAAVVPSQAVRSLAIARVTLVAFLATSAAALVVALVLGFGDIATMMGRLHLGVGDGVIYTLGNAALAPNAVVFGGSFLLGPGFSVGAQTLVSPGAVVLGPLPLVALLAALPQAGSPAAWVSALVALPPLVAVLAVARWHRANPATSWSEAALTGCGGGLLAGLVFTALGVLSGGSAGPGRMSHVGPFVGDVLVQSLATFGLSGIAGALVMTWWTRRAEQATP